MTNGLRNHPGPTKIRSWEDEQRSARRHRLFWRLYSWATVAFIVLTIASALFRT